MIQISFELIVGPPGSAYTVSFYFQPLLWRWGKIDYHEQMARTSTGESFLVSRIGWMIGPFTVYAGRR